MSLVGCGGTGAGVENTALQEQPLNTQDASFSTGVSEQQSTQVAQSAVLSDEPVTLGNLGPEGTSGLTIGDGRRYPLNSAIGDIWGVSESHHKVDFTLTNGNFKVEPIVVNGESILLITPAESTAVFFASVFTPGDSFDYASYDTYAFAQNGLGQMPGVGYFKDAYVGVDTNENGSVDADERYSVIDGTVSFTAMAVGMKMNFSVTLSNGQSVTGDYSGLLDYTIR